MQANPAPRKTLLIDRDGTLIHEPSGTFQVNSLEELRLLPGVITALHRLSCAGYDLIFVSNQDALGTAQNPRENYEYLNDKLFALLGGEGIEFAAVFTCPHIPADGCACRKPGTGMVDAYLRRKPLLLSDSFMVGDRGTDGRFAGNLGIPAFLLDSETHPDEDRTLSVEQKLWTWPELAHYILQRPRCSRLARKTKETDISIELNLDAPDGQGRYQIATGLHFFDHMLEQLSRHGGMDLSISCKGDLEIDAHHTVEDVALALGQAFADALGDKRGIVRYSWERVLVMDEVRCEISIDLSGRPYVVFDADFPRPAAGDLPTEMVEHFFVSFCSAAKINLHLHCHSGHPDHPGKGLKPNTHHMVEACFKALARCLKDAVRREGTGISSTKGLL
ncbi:imidazoleglycerol-phosphate dehydratase HisB [Candidatus Haliotispira prima]|uniref:Imidazoleglycerol-phosphate dehydratase n=1 Tax=Candidatus Haliotispira prima TaxID=3034016 RepID=A0ABY8MGC4_9SPIO|nr:imidazoleglycerol-phosphate dehydratase HisB [Candidatus Haliotispira prima]